MIDDQTALDIGSIANDILDQKLDHPNDFLPILDDILLSDNSKNFLAEFYTRFIEVYKNCGAAYFQKITCHTTLTALYKILSNKKHTSFYLVNLSAGYHSPAALLLAQAMIKNPIFMRNLDIDHLNLYHMDLISLANHLVNTIKDMQDDKKWLSEMLTTKSIIKLYLLSDEGECFEFGLHDSEKYSLEYLALLKKIINEKKIQMENQKIPLQKEVNDIHSCYWIFGSLSIFFGIACVIFLLISPSIIPAVLSLILSSVMILTSFVLYKAGESSLKKTKECLNEIDQHLNKANSLIKLIESKISQDFCDQITTPTSKHSKPLLYKSLAAESRPLVTEHHAHKMI